GSSMNVVDRRPNPKGKSLSNRQRFLSRARVEVKSAVQEALRKRKVADVEHGEKVAIPTRGISEPIFHHNRRTGKTDHIIPGNKEYVRGDEIPRPTGGEGQGGREGSPDGSGAARASPIATRSMCAIAASTGCRVRTRKPSCSA